MLIVRLMDRFIEFVSRVTWPAIGLVFSVLYILGAIVFELFEPRTSGFLSLANYTWWYLVTITTVGYGDLAPVSGPGRATAAIVMLFGIGTVGVVLGKLGEAIFEIGRKRMRGQVRLKERGHLVIFGYTAGETEQMIAEIVADLDWSERSIVLCSAEQAENPLPDRVKFVRGPLASDDVMERACVADADVIIIDCNDDNTAIVTAIAANTVNPSAHIVVSLASPESAKHVRRISPRFECVLPMRIPMTVQALQDPGSTRVMQALMSNVHDDVLYRVEVPEAVGDAGDAPAWRFGDLFDAFKRSYDAILVGSCESRARNAEVELNPSSEAEIRGGMVLYYIASRRLGQIDWATLPR